MNDEEIGLNFFTEGEPRSPEGLPSVFGAINQAEMLARIDEVQDDDLVGSFFADSLIEVEAAATRVFEVRLRPRSDAAVEPSVVPPVEEPLAAEQEAPPTELTPDDIFASPTVAEPVAEPEAEPEAEPVDEPDTAVAPVEQTVVIEEQPAFDVEETADSAPAVRQSRLGAAREEVVAIQARTVITVPGILSTSAEARRSFILGGPAAVNEGEFG